MGIWHKSLLLFALVILGGATVNYLIFGGEYTFYLRGSSTAAIIIGLIAYRQKRKWRKQKW